MPGYEVAIFDLDGIELQEPGEIGEICVRSDIGFKGYHDRPDETAASCRGARTSFN